MKSLTLGLLFLATQHLYATCASTVTLMTANHNFESKIEFDFNAQNYIVVDGAKVTPTDSKIKPRNHTSTYSTATYELYKNNGTVTTLEVVKDIDFQNPDSNYINFNIATSNAQETYNNTAIYFTSKNVKKRHLPEARNVTVVVENKNDYGYQVNCL